MLAAELGKALLDKNEELSRQNERIAEEFSQKLEVGLTHLRFPNVFFVFSKLRLPANWSDFLFVVHLNCFFAFFALGVW